jgi:hypothetical protein
MKRTPRPWVPGSLLVGLCRVCGIATLTVNERGEPQHPNCAASPPTSDQHDSAVCTVRDVFMGNVTSDSD